MQISSAEKYGVDARWIKSGGKIDWQPDDSFVGMPKITTLQPGARIDRYGLARRGKYLAPKGTPFEQRALPDSFRSGEYHQYEVVKPFPIQTGKTASWFDQPGGGTQYKLEDEYDVEKLIEDAYLKEIK